MPDHIHDLPVCGFGAHNPNDPSCSTVQGRMIACGEIVDKNNPNFGKALCRHKVEAEKKIGCFIATAAYGSELAPPVQFLRDFRDDIVLKSRFRRGFTTILDFYYVFSPHIADMMRRNKPLKYVMKYTIVWPFVATSMACAYLIKKILKNRD